ncbi:MAG: extracellular solute-binding protein [Candidatus Colwellbacteria bacterium]|nr:extracellular solute-binding protein [Candidatus Colwellbacteria bacterium]
MNFSKSQLIILGIGGFIVLSFILIFVFGLGKRTNIQKADITFWGIERDEYFADAIGSFEEKYPGVTVKYREIAESGYEKELVDSFAAGNGPDVFMFGSRWLPRHANKITPISEEMMTVGKFNDFFPEVAAQDFVMSGKIYSLPLYIDTLVLYYNRSIFDKLAVPLPPKTWDEFKGLVLIKKASASIGGYYPLVARSADIIDAMLMQAGTDLNLQNKTFVRLATDGGVKALTFYTQFSPKEETLTGFAGERTAMIFGYHSDKALIKAKAPFLDLGVASLPQFYSASPVVPARYYGLSVSAKSSHQDLAWELATHLTTDKAVAESLVAKGTHPPALRDLIQKYSDSADLGVFAKQALIARSWFQPDDREVVTIFNDMIKSAISSRKYMEALRAAEGKINNLIPARQ